jgi:arginase
MCRQPTAGQPRPGRPISRRAVVLGAPSAIGIRPYDHGAARRLDLAPDALRNEGVARELDARDLGDVRPPDRYRDFERPAGRCRNDIEVAAYSRALAERIARVSGADEFVVLLGGDCSILLGALLGLRRARGEPLGLIYIDAHADFATLDESPSHSACSMNLALATGRAEEPLAHLAGQMPLVRGEHVVHIGRRDDDQPAYGWGALAPNGVLDLSRTKIESEGIAAVAEAALERAGGFAAGFWTAFDVDVIDPTLMPAVDTPIPGGLDFDQTAELLSRLLRHPRALGLQVTIYDPNLDPDRGAAAQLADMLIRSLADVQ